MSGEFDTTANLSRQERRKLEREHNKFNPYSPKERYAIEKNKEVILNFAKKRNIKKNLKEQQLWREHDFIPPNEPPPPLSAETVEKAVGNFEETLSLMRKSENTHFQDTIEFLDQHEDDITFVIDVKKPLTSKNRLGFMGVRLHVDHESDSYSWLLDLNPQYLAISPPFYPAVSLAHEKQHLEDFMQIQEVLPASTSLAERLQLHQTRLTTDTLFLLDEARGWGKQCDATIMEYGLGFEGNLPPDLLKLTTDYISFGANMDNKEWIKYVGKNIYGFTHYKT